MKERGSRRKDTRELSAEVSRLVVNRGLELEALVPDIGEKPWAWGLCLSSKGHAFSQEGPSVLSSAPYERLGHVLHLACFQSADVSTSLSSVQIQVPFAIPLTYYNLRACGDGESNSLE